LESLSLTKMLSVVNAFELSNIQEEETEVALIKRSECNNVTLRRKPLKGVLVDHRRISPSVLEVAEGVGRRTIKHAEKEFVDSAVAASLLEDGAATWQACRWPSTFLVRRDHLLLQGLPS
jgi:hypothetical protein